MFFAWEICSTLCIAARASSVFQQRVDVEGGAATEIVPVLRKERVGRGTAFVAEEAEKGPLPVELGRGAEFGHRLGGDALARTTRRCPHVQTLTWSMILKRARSLLEGLMRRGSEELFATFSSTGFRSKRQCDSSRSPAQRESNAGKIESSIGYLVQWAVESDPTRSLSALQPVCPR